MKLYRALIKQQHAIRWYFRLEKMIGQYFAALDRCLKPLRYPTAHWADHTREHFWSILAEYVPGISEDAWAEQFNNTPSWRRALRVKGEADRAKAKNQNSGT